MKGGHDEDHNVLDDILGKRKGGPTDLGGTTNASGGPATDISTTKVDGAAGAGGAAPKTLTKKQDTADSRNDGELGGDGVRDGEHGGGDIGRVVPMEPTMGSGGDEEDERANQMGSSANDDSMGVGGTMGANDEAKDELEDGGAAGATGEAMKKQTTKRDDDDEMGAGRAAADVKSEERTDAPTDLGGKKKRRRKNGRKKTPRNAGSAGANEPRRYREQRQKEKP